MDFGDECSQTHPDNEQKILGPLKMMLSPQLMRITYLSAASLEVSFLSGSKLL